MTLTKRRICYIFRSKKVPLQLLLLLLLLAFLALALLQVLSRRRFLDLKKQTLDEAVDVLVPLDIHVPTPTIGSNFQDSYLCTSFRLPNDSTTMYIVKFEPRGDLTHVHHMLLAVCNQLPTSDQLWNCGGMSLAASDAGPAAVTPAQPMEMCASGLRYLYAYAMHAPPLRLPQGVAFPLGGDYRGRHLVLQVHYTSESQHHGPTPTNPSLPQPHHHHHHHSHMSGRPTSGIRLGLLPRGAESPKRLSGVHLSATGGLIQPRSVAHLSAGCPYNGDVALHPFAFRVHTHRLGRVVSVYLVAPRYLGQGHHKHEWTLIGRANPQLAQMFYPVNSSDLTLTPGDGVAALCVMENESDHLVRIGPTARDEMCNAYVMYWYSSEHPGDWHHGCMSKGYSDLWWDAPQWVMKQASSVPGSDRYLPPRNDRS